MKKNFMAIASLLIAAMLLVVSCAPEANVEGKVEDNGLVNASLMATAAGKALTVSSPTGEALSYTITLAPEWSADTNYKMDEVVGRKTINVSSINNPIDLGWISQGLWTVKVEGKRNNEIVVEGSTKKYITKGNAGVVVFLGTKTDSGKATYLDFDITVNELAANNAGYSLKASIVSADGRDPSFNENYTSFEETNGVNTKTYKITSSEENPVVSLTPGYYKVTLQLLNDANVIGGITRGVLVTGESKITIMGSVSASDFAKGSLKVYTPTVKIGSFTAVKDDTTSINIPYNDDNQRYQGTAADDDGSYKIKYTVTASLDDDVTSSGVTVNTTPTYTWIVDGKVVTTKNEQGQDVEHNAPSCEVSYSAPGDKNVTCIITYACTATIGLTEYDFTIGNEAVAYVQVK